MSTQPELGKYVRAMQAGDRIVNKCSLRTDIPYRVGLYDALFVIDTSVASHGIPFNQFQSFVGASVPSAHPPVGSSRLHVGAMRI